MKSRFLVVLIIVLAGEFGAQAQTVAGSSPLPVAAPQAVGTNIFFGREMGKWWQDSDVAKKLQLTDGQISQLNQIFYQHRLRLIDSTAEMEKADLKLDNLLDTEAPDDNQVNSQVDAVLAARSKLERDFTGMNVDVRKVLTLQQWQQLKTIHGGIGMPGKVFFHRSLPPGAPLPPPPDDLAPPPPQ
jgi:Spy/CpxP family protein refolding chaperone